MAHLNHHPLASCQPSSSRGPQPSRTSSSSSNSATNTSSPKPILHWHYHVLLSGDNGDLQRFLDDDPRRVSEINNNTILHLAAIANCDDAAISAITTRCSDLLNTPNSQGDRPIHLAARGGHLSMVQKLVECARSVPGDGIRKMLEKTNNDGNTALHVALENQQFEMAKFLFNNCKHTFYKLNNQRISPLYLAVKAGFWDGLVGDMLRYNPGGAAENELCSIRRSVVHAIIMAKPKQPEIFAEIINHWSSLIIESLDEKGRRPLSYAAYIGYTEGVNRIMEDEHLLHLAYKPDEDGSFPIHRACMGGHLVVVKRLLGHSHGMKWLLNREGQNILHVAASHGKLQVVDYILKRRDLSRLVNMKDHNGSTPLHLATMHKQPKVVYALTWNSEVNLHLQDKEGFTALDLTDDYGEFPTFQQRLTWLALVHAGAQKAPQNVINVQTINQASVLTTDHSDQPTLNNHTIFSTISLKPKKNKYKDRLNPLLVVATLVATVTYASGFTVPGGYSQDGGTKGSAILTGKFTFQIFVIANTIALYSSLLAVVSLIWAHLDDLRLMFISLKFALYLLGTSITMMSISFMSSLFVVLPDRPWLRWLVVAMQVIFMFVLFAFFIPLYSPTSYIKYRCFRWVVGFSFELMLLACDQTDKETLY